MYQRILIPVDQSPTSQAAVLEASRFVHERPAQLRLLHVVDIAQFAFNSNELVDIAQLQQCARQAGQNILEQHTGVLVQAGLKPEAQLLEVTGGNLAQAIIEEAKTWSAELIIMGTHGFTGLTHLLLGSVAEGVIHHTPVPVLLIRTSTQ